MAIIVKGETRCDGFGCEDHDACIKKYAERDRLMDLFDEVYPEKRFGTFFVGSDMKVHLAKQHELIEQYKDETHVERATMMGLSVRNRKTKEVYNSTDIEVFRVMSPDSPDVLHVQGMDARIVKFHTELLQSVIELYAIPTERLRKVIQNNDLKKTEAKSLEGVKHTHTLYKALFDSLEYIHNKYFKKD